MKGVNGPSPDGWTATGPGVWQRAGLMVVHLTPAEARTDGGRAGYWCYRDGVPFVRVATLERAKKLCLLATP